MQEILVAATPPLVAALIAALGFWLRRRSHANKVQQAVEEARANIAMITSWINAHKDLDPASEHAHARQKALEDLERVYHDFSAAEQASKAKGAEPSASSVVRALLLLDSRASSAVGKFMQVLYYVSLAWVVLWVAAAFLFGLASAFSDTAGSLGEQLAFSFGITVLCLAIGSAPALLLFLLVRMFAEQYRHTPGPQGGHGSTSNGGRGTESWPRSE